MRALRLLGDDNRHAFDNMVEFNPAIQAGIRRWLTDAPGADEQLRELPVHAPPDVARVRAPGAAEALLFGIMARNQRPRARHTSRRRQRAVQFMPATGRRFGLGPDGTGSIPATIRAVRRSAEYLNERLGQLNNDMEMSLAGYNGGEGRAARAPAAGGTGF